MSQEVLDDVEHAANGIDQVLYRTITNTENKNMWETLNAIAATSITKVDELRDLLTTLTYTNEVKIYVTQEAYNNFDKAGLVKQSSKYDSGTILGKELINIEGEDNLTFIGNLKELIFFDRSNCTINYEQHLHYSEAINLAARHDVKLLDGNEIKKITLKPVI